MGCPFRLGATGEGGEIDCIHLVYLVLNTLEIPTPAFRQEWYEQSSRTVLRDLLRWGERVKGPIYTGDVVLLPQESWAFGVVWREGVLHISRAAEKVGWCSTEAVASTAHFFRMKESYAAPSASQKTNGRGSRKKRKSAAT